MLKIEEKSGIVKVYFEIESIEDLVDILKRLNIAPHTLNEIDDDYPDTKHMDSTYNLFDKLDDIYQKLKERV